MKKVLYQKTQNGLLLNIILFVSITSLLFALKMPENTNGSRFVLIALILLLITVWLLLYKLTIVIDKDTITAIFGIGFLKRKIKIEDIDFTTLEIVKPHFLTGIGIRLTPKGWLWNVKFGKAIFFKTKNGKTFFVGTDEPDVIKETLSKIKQLN